ncbi:MAG: 2-oxo acid dehydrogenase subunit E2, partial [Planctomycetes bacterium]|nr:2-oxo acid dehydrogenase subunit E2 [Planctomycetota bacterium]
MLDIVVPSVGESITEVQVSRWLKKEGEWVAAGTDLVDLETEKASVQISAPEDGILLKILKKNEEFATVGDVIATFQPAAKGAEAPTPSVAPAPPASASSATASQSGTDPRVMPAARRMLEDHQLSASQVPASGPGGRVLKEDVSRYVAQATNSIGSSIASVGAAATQATVMAAKTVAATLSPPAASSSSTSIVQSGSPNRSEEIKPMSMIRKTIASRLVQAQQTAALLTTFNEVDMQPVMALRTKYKDAFQEKHGVKLGFMSFFAKACCEALKRFPSVNAEIRGSNIVYRNYFDIGIAIG